MNKKVLDAYTLEKEDAVRAWWKKEGIAEKARAASQKNGKPYYFVDGPPYATGHIHMGTALNKILKDTVLRSRRMMGFNVWDQPGYDTHGLPIEHQIEKELGFKEKKDIEAFGVEKFVAKCREYATKFIGTMNAEFENLGVWMDWERPYKTLDNSYIEGAWWTFKEAYKKGLLFLDKYSVQVCPRCATAVAYNEIEYAKQTDVGIFVKMKATDEKNTFYVIWTTTPWTLPANMGIMAHPDFEYAYVKLSNGERLVMAKEKVEELMSAVGVGYSIEKVVKGAELKGKRYENPLAPHLKLPTDLGEKWKIVLSGRYVNLVEGSGLVHCAPGHGKEDYEVGKENGLPIHCPVKVDGTLDGTAGRYAGGRARAVDKEIVADLEKAGALVYKHNYTHDYPFCWRCKTPLLVCALPQWFFRVTKIRERMVELNRGVNWVPAWMRDRMNGWLESLGDWPISRERFWGIPLPIWVSEDGSEIEVFGSVEELRKKAKAPENLDLHKPGIDAITFKGKNGQTMKRVPHVLDVWFDAGVDSWAAIGYPKEKKVFDEFWPADLNLEGTDQFRGWWNSELITSTICFDKAPFKSIAVHGMVLDEKRKKMSKSAGNVVKPEEVIAKYNRDYLRMFFVRESRGEDLPFVWDAFKELHKFYNILLNSYNYLKTYYDFDAASTKVDEKALETEDRWLLSRVNRLAREARAGYESYHLHRTAAAVEAFVVGDLSRSYIKLVRDRAGSDSEKAVAQTLNYALQRVLGLLAPIAPHFTEYVYRDFRAGKMPESIHLTGLPACEEAWLDEALEKEFGLVEEMATHVLALREENKLRRRWPLRELVVQSEAANLLPRARGLLATLCNVQSVRETRGQKKDGFAERVLPHYGLHLDVSADGALKDEWEFRELTRLIQEKRKEARLTPGETVELKLGCDDAAFVEAFKARIEAETSTTIVPGKGKQEKLLDRAFFIELIG